eukprot:3943662-Pyramimonas_sp.AAC.1
MIETSETATNQLSSRVGASEAEFSPSRAWRRWTTCARRSAVKNHRGQSTGAMMRTKMSGGVLSTRTRGIRRHGPPARGT